MARFQDWCRENCRLRKEKFFAGTIITTVSVGNFDSIDDFHYQVTRILYRLMNRRSQRRSYNWKGFTELIKVFKLQRPRICHSF